MAIDLNKKMIEVVLNCNKIAKMREDRSTKVVELDNLYESTIQDIIKITPDVAINQWLDNRLDDHEMMTTLVSVDRNYAEQFIEDIINNPPS